MFERPAKGEDVGTIKRDNVCGPAGVRHSSFPFSMWYALMPLMAYKSFGSCQELVVWLGDGNSQAYIVS